MKTALLAVVLVGVTGSSFGQDLTPPPAPPVLEPFVPMPTPTFHVENESGVPKLKVCSPLHTRR